MLAHAEPPGYRRGLPRGRPKLGAFVGVIDEILAGDADPSTPRKQRHTARRIFERLRDEHGYLGGEVAVRRYVASQRRVSGEVFVPLSQPAGEAQFDFGEATVEIAGVRVKAALAVMTLPYSDAFLVSAYPRECTETFQALTVTGGVERVEISSGTELVATHPRDWGAEHTSYDPRHYLALLERKPGAFDFARPLERWDLPLCFRLLRRRLEADLGSSGTREFIKVLRLMERASLHQLTGAVEVALRI